MTESYVTFRGAAAKIEELKAELGDRVEFSGVGEVTHVGTEKREDGERRPIVKIKVLEVDVDGVAPAPKDEQLPFAEDDD